MRKIIFLLLISSTFSVAAQDLTFKKGVVTDSVFINDSIQESFALYMPKNFDNAKNWPVIFLFDEEGRGRQLVRFFQEAAEQEGYILAASNNVHDSLPISKNILISNRMFNRTFQLFSIHAKRIYTGGISGGGRLASVIPVFVPNIEGVVSFGGTLGNVEVLSSKNLFHYIGIVSKEDYNYPMMLSDEILLNKLKFPNQLLLLNNGDKSKELLQLQKAMQIFTLSAMAKGNIALDEPFVQKIYDESLREIEELMASKKLLEAEKLIEETQSVFRVHKRGDDLKEKLKSLKRDKLFRSQSRNESNMFFKESLIKEDYNYYLEEDVLTYNFNNLGWWNYQMEELKKYESSQNEAERQMGKRLYGFVNALVDDMEHILANEAKVDEDALLFVLMLKTITNPKSYDAYLKVVSYSSKMEDYGTALFYAEELLKNGFTDKTALYSLEHTALLRITPEFNDLVTKYLDDARYEIKEQ
ncbi:alpha/beta hydrolase [Sediminicola sp. 1XM1-17]|uniref:alpha/beta hydrolase n=1 Tax=Sediminicola sp. 1XM1-17 TaxID=3127702 RepID=UPI003077F396